MLRALLEAGADLERTNTQGETVLITAIRRGDLGLVQLFVNHGANVNACTGNGQPCLVFALEQRQYAFVSYLLAQESCEVDVCGAYVHRLLKFCLEMDDDSSVIELKNRGATLDSRHPVRS